MCIEKLPICLINKWHEFFFQMLTTKITRQMPWTATEQLPIPCRRRPRAQVSLVPAVDTSKRQCGVFSAGAHRPAHWGCCTRCMSLSRKHQNCGGYSPENLTLCARAWHSLCHVVVQRPEPGCSVKPLPHHWPLGGLGQVAQPLWALIYSSAQQMWCRSHHISWAVMRIKWHASSRATALAHVLWESLWWSWS